MEFLRMVHSNPGILVREIQNQPYSKLTPLFAIAESYLHMPMRKMADESACPVDHKTRDAWIAQAKAPSEPPQAPSACPVGHQAHQPPPLSPSWTQTLASYIWSSSSPAAPSPDSPRSPVSSLETSRIISSIPRAPTNPSATPTSSSSSSSACPAPHGASANPPNHEYESGAHSSGNWIYPSEKMFFDAMKRKGYEAREVDMKTVVPIHNAVNERAWKQILEWEAPYLKSPKCSGPMLESFGNKKDRMTPTARLNTLLGYTAPFDRHDWVIDRCGTRVEYVIDFYPGRSNAGSSAVPSFYLDVRPKLNTWEGVKMRLMRWTALA